MKKLIIAASMLLALTSFSFGQAKPATKMVTKKDSTTKHVTTTAKTTTTSTVPLKKDGTPDKRYKATEAAGPVKKDGTPDKRYKENKKPK